MESLIDKYAYEIDKDALDVRLLNDPHPVRQMQWRLGAERIGWGEKRWQLPGSDKAEFVLILPFTPKNRQVLIGWIAALSDGYNYGRFIAYKFPKERRVLGPQQVETKIDQDSFLSGQLTLWDQQGSEVIRGNVLAIPLDDSLLYVEPLYAFTASAEAGPDGEASDGALVTRIGADARANRAEAGRGDLYRDGITVRAPTEREAPEDEANAVLRELAATGSEEDDEL